MADPNASRSVPWPVRRKVRAKGQIVIPKAMCEYLGIRVGDRLHFEWDEFLGVIRARKIS